MIRSPRRSAGRSRVVLAALGAIGGMLLVGCQTGQQAQTAGQRPTIDGTNAQAGSIALRDITLAYPENGVYEAGGEARLDMIVVNAEQNAELKRASTPEIELSVVAESPSDDLIALLRLFAPTRAAQEDARRVMARAECLPAPSVMPAQASGG